MTLPSVTVRYRPEQNGYEAILDGVSLGTFPKEIDATMAGHRARLDDLDDASPPHLALLGADLHLAFQITDLRPMPAPVPQQYSTTPLEALTATLILLNRNWLRATLAGRHTDAQQIEAHEACVRAQIHTRLSANK